MFNMNFENLFNSFANIKVGVVGDVMLDTYWWGNVERISPEAPVPIVAIKSKELRLGGAANVCLNLVSLKAQTTVLTVLGKDDAALQLKNIFEENNIQTNFIVIDESRPTTNKTRVIARNQQMMRLDEETTKDIASNIFSIVVKLSLLSFERLIAFSRTFNPSEDNVTCPPLP